MRYEVLAKVGDDWELIAELPEGSDYEDAVTCAKIQGHLIHKGRDLCIRRIGNVFDDPIAKA